MKLNDSNKKLIFQFVAHCKKELVITGNIKIFLTNKGLEHPTAGGYDPETDKIIVCIKNRAIADCMRTIAHELTHQKQRQEIDSFPSDDEELQPLEDDANTKSGKLVRFWGRENPEIYTDLK